MKLNGRLLFMIIGSVIVVMGIIIGAISKQSSNMAISSAEMTLKGGAEGLAYQVKQEIDYASQTAKTLSHTFESMKLRNVTDRQLFNETIKQVLVDNEKLLGIYSVWNRDAFDGLDEHFINQEGHDDSGRLIPYWVRNNGEIEVQPMEGYNNLDNDYYYPVIETGVERVIEPLLYPIDGQDVFMTSVVYPIHYEDKVVGVVGANLTLEQINQINHTVKFYESGFSTIISEQGNIIAHPNEELFGEDYFKFLKGIELLNIDYYDLIDLLKTGQDAFVTAKIDEQIQYFYFASVPLVESGGFWTTVVQIPEAELKKEARDVVWMTVMIAGVGVITIAFVISLVVSRTTRKIKDVLKSGSRMARGDFSREIPVRLLNRSDEIGDIAKAFATISTNLRTMLEEVIMKANIVLHTAKQVEKSSETSAKVTESISNSTQETESRAYRQLHRAEACEVAMGEMATGIQQVAESSAVMAHAANSMDKQARNGRKAIQTTIQQIESIHEKSELAVQVVRNLDEQSEKISEIIQVISDISSQTNLLALNAAIEAARAGNEGKGFTVVAMEIRKLADETSHSTKQIAELVDAIQEQVRQVVTVSSESKKEVQEGQQMVQEIGQLFKHIASSTEGVTEQIDSLSSITEQMSIRSEDVKATVNEMAKSSKRVADSAEQVAASTQEEQASIEELLVAAKTLTEMAEELKEMIGQFKL